MLCDSCDRGWHGLCLTPPLLPSSRSKARWTCPTCQSHVTFFDPPSLEEGRTKRAVGAPPSSRPVSAANALGPAREQREKRRRSSAGEWVEEGLEGVGVGVGGAGGGAEESARKEKKRKNAAAMAVARKGKARAEGVAAAPFAAYPWELVGDREEEGVVGGGGMGAGAGAGAGGARLTLKLGGAGAGASSTPRPPKKRPEASTPVLQPWRQQQHAVAPLPEEPEEQEEEEEPYGGILRGEAASNEGRVPSEADRLRWGRSREEAEVCPRSSGDSLASD